ncbi:MAG: hypothetical protein ISN26_02325 [Betaproteobacteria bacterium AqS2]|uniref:Porin n=1 Tax=Candidatus Amphirhobacter heronislandensis TaxID=1732024 RepID=A0A930UBL1_9GAMM|nr:hypothetical protein [Betaproteobacteria bacterium AqS2]
MKKIAIATTIALLASPLAWSQRSADTAVTIGIDFGELELANYGEYCRQAQSHLEGVTLQRFSSGGATTTLTPMRAQGPCADIQYTYRLRAALRINDWLTAKGSYMTAETFSSSHNMTVVFADDGLEPDETRFKRFMGGLGSYETEFSLFQLVLQGEREMAPDLFVAGRAGIRNYDIETSFSHEYHHEIPDNEADKAYLDTNREILNGHMPSLTEQRTGSGSVLLLGGAVERQANRNLAGVIEADLAYDFETEETAVEYAFFADWTVIENASLRLGYEAFAAGPEEMSQLFLGAGYSLEF